LTLAAINSRFFSSLLKKYTFKAADIQLQGCCYFYIAQWAKSPKKQSVGEYF